MNWALYAIAAFMLLSILLVIKDVGKTRDPVTPGTALTVTVIFGVIIGVLILAAVRLS